jgi:hypothetical protein
VQQEVALLEGLLHLLAANDLHLGKACVQHLLDAVVHLARPQPHLDLWQMLFQQRQHTRRVRDVADVHCLPRRAQDEPFRLFRSDGGNERQGGGGADEMAAIHDESESATDWGLRTSLNLRAFGHSFWHLFKK